MGNKDALACFGHQQKETAEVQSYTIMCSVAVLNLCMPVFKSHFHLFFFFFFFSQKSLCRCQSTFFSAVLIKLCSSNQNPLKHLWPPTNCLHGGTSGTGSPCLSEPVARLNVRAEGACHAFSPLVGRHQSW